MKLESLLKYNDIIIQCHDFPDADTIASGYALYCYLTDHFKSPRLIYGGKKQITKPNLALMVRMLEIPIEYVTETDHVPELLITVDCVHGEGNVTHFEAKEYAAIDHQVSVAAESPLFDIRPEFGSCSSVMSLLLKEANYNFNSISYVATALYYGLYTDTNGMAELNNPVDRDLRDYAEFDTGIIRLLVNSNLTEEELKITSEALNALTIYDRHKFALV
ncbi:MAG: bifunctional oligoribonuclease/PAP phosphatase NrnA, partial [Huintestinicola sp.]